MFELPPPSPLTAAAFVAVCLLVAGLWIAGAYVSASTPARARRDAALTALALAAWMALTAGIAASGVLSSASLPPPVMFYLMGNVAVTLAVACSRLGGRLAREVPLWALVAAQGFRLPLELVLWRLHLEGSLPSQMTFEGGNLDILTALTALPLAWWLWRGGAPRAAVVAWNALGSTLLAIVVMIALLSAPLPLRQLHEEPAVLLVFHAPYTWIVSVLVASALAGHILVGRALRAWR